MFWLHEQHSNPSGKKISWNAFTAIGSLVLAMILAPAVAFGQFQSKDNEDKLNIMAYWTAERLEAAQPYPMPVFQVDQANRQAEALEVGEPGGAGGSPPDTAFLPQSQAEGDAGIFGPAPRHIMDPNTDYPPPFTRWTWFGRYLTYPMSTVAKMFFDQDHDGDGVLSSFVCSASVVDMGGDTVDRVATAGHCVNNALNGAGANGGWSTNVLVCPSYNAGGVNPVRGCWAAPSLATYTGWITSANADLDIACLHTNPTGTIVANEIGNVTGTLGRAWNFNDEPITAFGYPAIAPFPGWHIIISVSTDWYNVNWGTGPDSKYIGSDQTGGSSGGPWIIGLEHRTAGYPDTDGSSATDPLTGGPFPEAGFLDGVNSHKRVCGAVACVCGGPGALCTQEMGGPNFTNAAGGTEDLFAFCTTI